MDNHLLFSLELESDIADFIKELKKYSDNLVEERLVNILKYIPLPFTVLIETIYNDKTYRDSYYFHFSSKYSKYKKDSVRLAFFESIEFSFDDFFSEDGQDRLQEKFIGTIVIKPIKPGSVGKTLLNPSKLDIEPSLLRLTEYESTVFGTRLKLMTFPFSSQDSETMTCAETAIWSLMKYYGTRYSMYKVVLPSDIQKATNSNSVQRILPSSGLIYSQTSDALKKFGFVPKYYTSSDFLQPCDKLKKILNYYISSGIPVLTGVNLKKNDTPSGHLVVCVGHANNIDYDKGNSYPCGRGKVFKDTSEMIDIFSFMDDNQTPFSLQSYNNFEFYTENSDAFDSTNIKYLIVPLYKRIFLTAENASKYFYSVFTQPHFGLARINESEEFIINIFLASSRKYKNFRSVNYSTRMVAQTYLDLPLPKFIWVSEISTRDKLLNNKIIGEIILDATAFGYNIDESIIMIHYPGFIASRKPEEKLNDLLKNAKIFSETNIEYEAFSSNLTLV